MMRIGIDLGTTFSCVAALNERSRPALVPNELEQLTTPMVMWFDGHEAWIGDCAYQKEKKDPGYLIDYVKRDMGKPPEIPPHLFDQAEAPPTAPYNRGGYNWGVIGIQAIFLRKLKRDAIRYFHQKGRFPGDLEEDQVRLDTVITVPAYFKDIEREQTRQAAECAGLHVIGIINEPTAAALAYRLVRSGSKRIFVFDLGGGTFDVTFLELRADGKSDVLASDGNPHLGGKDYDDFTYRYLYEEYELRCSEAVPEIYKVELRQKAIKAKEALSDAETAAVELHCSSGERFSVILHRKRPADLNPYVANGFYFETKSRNLLTQIAAICERARRAVRFEPIPSHVREMKWDDVDEVVLVGGSCRMPMIVEFLEAHTGKEIRRHPEGFDLDTAVATGAAFYALRPDLVTDVASGTYGIKLRRREGGLTYDFIQPLIRKNTPLPAEVEREYRAGAHAVFELYQGESDNPEFCVLRGRLKLENPEGSVTVKLHMDRDGRLAVVVSLPGEGDSAPIQRTLEIRNDFFVFNVSNGQHNELTERVRAVTIHDCSVSDG